MIYRNWGKHFQNVERAISGKELILNLFAISLGRDSFDASAGFDSTARQASALVVY